MTLETRADDATNSPEPLWPGFSQRTFPIEDPLGRDASLGAATPHPEMFPGESEIAALQHVNAAVSCSEDPGRAVHAGLRSSLAVTHATVGSLWLFQSDGALVRVAHAGLTKAYLDEFASRPDWIAVQHRILAQPDVVTQSDAEESPQETVRLNLPPGIHSTIAIPLRTRGLRVGALLLGNPQPDWASKHSLGFLRTLGEILAGALDSARLVADLRSSKELHVGLLGAAHDAIVLVGPDGNITEANSALERLLGRARKSVLGRPMSEFLRLQDRSVFDDLIVRLISSGTPIVGEARTIVTRDGGSVSVVLNATRFTEAAGDVRGAVIVIHDQREHRAAERLVHDAHDQLTHLLRHLDVGVALLNRADLTIVEHNPALARMCDASDLDQRRFPGLLPAREWTEVSGLLERALAAGGARTLDDLEVRLPGRAPMFWTVTLAPLQPQGGGPVTHLVLTAADITGRRDLEERYRHAQKMEAVGTLAGGIAHEFNNLLTAILGNVTLSLLDLPEDHPLSPGLRDCESAAQRAADLTRQLLGFGRRTPMRTRPTDLREVVAESLPLVGRVVDPRISIERNDEPGLWTSLADPAHIGQAFMNLCVNARDAMPEGGRLRVATRNVPAGQLPDREGEYVMLEVSDTGQGIAPEVLERIYEPFFTTRGPNHGPGLGLSVVYGIAEQHGGWIECKSAPGEGTSFRLYLPRFVAQPAEALPEPGRGEVVLVVDDEESVRTLAKSVLERLGYQVRQAADGIEALALVRENASAVHIVVLDQTMPRMSGVETLAELRRIAPGLPVILTSGYEPGGGPQGGDGGTADGFLPKPYPPDSLSRLVRQLLDSRPRPADTRAARKRGGAAGLTGGARND
ncbi:MAG: PAS domain-containing protein [Candidatus Eisenbacteria bacterium]|nr:PAS domain-containing protein [Candidatus Eisenbacteria bacterium]